MQKNKILFSVIFQYFLTPCMKRKLDLFYFEKLIVFFPLMDSSLQNVFECCGQVMKTHVYVYTPFGHRPTYARVTCPPRHYAANCLLLADSRANTCIIIIIINADVDYYCHPKHTHTRGILSPMSYSDDDNNNMKKNLRRLRMTCLCRNYIYRPSRCMRMCIIFIQSSATDLHYYLWMWFESSRPPLPSPPLSPVSMHSSRCPSYDGAGAFTRTHFLCYDAVVLCVFFENNRNIEIEMIPR